MAKPVCEVCKKEYSERQKRKRAGAKHWAYRHIGYVGVTWCHGKDLNENFADVSKKENANK
jgi:hypothetical protein